MTQLIPLHSQTIDGNAVETVSARELHSFLESRQDFSTWIKNRIERYEFAENTDYLLPKTGELENKGFISFLVATKKPNGGRPSQELLIVT